MQFVVAAVSGELLRDVASVCFIIFRGCSVRSGQCCCGGGGSGRCGGGVLRGALGLQLGGVEDAVTAVGADGESLRVVLEGVGRGLGALVDDGELAALFEEVEGGVGSGAVDAAGSYVAGDAEVADVGLVAHALQLGDGDVVALVVAPAGEGEVGHGGEDDDGGYDDLCGVL